MSTGRRRYDVVVADFCVIPMGTASTSMTPYVAECQRVLQRSGLTHAMHAYGTNVEGPWDDVMNAIRDCHDAVHAMGCQRISTSIKIGTRLDKPSTIEGKKQSVADVLLHDEQHHRASPDG
ncbi:Thiamine-binding protein domain-containing protein [Plasmodiophora brassicae]|uniref:Thiamine-binding protein domain-containing protein n=1 Tax=Plasmodiophora brassicae TaxID=37360 RepID=A0A0G4J830_PLABS|nr:hypothetical protein PBRA_003255 [Plasmodiophora brassicae]SPQ99616.1 unnamed protein product [Plasmodiophora brassicae]